MAAFPLRRILATLAWTVPAFAQQPLAPLPRLSPPGDSLKIVRPAELRKPFTVAGPSGAILGTQDGSFEAWLWPVKIFSRFGITAEVDKETVDLAQLAASIEVTPAVTTITYSHAAFTVRQRIFATNRGVAVVFEIESVRPVTLTFRFAPDMQRMWPATSSEVTVEWVKPGYFLLRAADLAAAVAIPRARPSGSSEMKLDFDPKKDAGLAFPLLIDLGDPKTNFERHLASTLRTLPGLYSSNENYWAHFFETHLSAETPDASFDNALKWAEVAIEQGLVRFHKESGLIAGYGQSDASARPGFGWFFGRDSLWTSFAVNSYGDFTLTREALQFLIRRQRADGKMMHEFSQTADLVDWESLPYYYASADSTPLFVMAMADYVKTSGDVAFLRSHWDAVKRAYAFTRGHDSDKDGIYENTEGTGWVESWPPKMPHQEIYLAALDEQSAAAMAQLASLMHDAGLAESARKQAAHIREAIESEYYDAGEKFYAFSRDEDGAPDLTATMFPAVAWWNGTLSLDRAGPMLDRWGSSEFSTDWGTRDISANTPFYDPLSYHQGTVWPLFTGWVSLAEYRAGHPLSGYSHLMQNADLTWAQDLGAVTELFSGEFFQPMARSTPHQVWSSAMVITPALRGMFGLDWDALDHTLHVAPNLPASWNSARLHHVPLGDQKIDLEFTRASGDLVVRARSDPSASLCLAPANQKCDATKGAFHELEIPLPAVELEMPHGLPLAGSATAQLKAAGERRTGQSYEVDFEGTGGSQYELPVRLNRSGVTAAGGEIRDGKLRIRFPEGAGYQRLSVKFSW